MKSLTTAGIRRYFHTQTIEHPDSQILSIVSARADRRCRSRGGFARRLKSSDLYVPYPEDTGDGVQGCLKTHFSTSEFKFEHASRRQTILSHGELWAGNRDDSPWVVGRRVDPRPWVLGSARPAGP
jgi:hypothetical protein